jgi:putative transferase (TIGR04331 family)
MDPTIVRTLITTADERTWPKDERQPILFLGEWCKRYSRKHVWEHLDYEVMAYHWDDRKKLFEDYQYIQQLYEVLLFEMTDKLNQFHSINKSKQYWRILIGPWLGYFIGMVYDRWFMLKKAIIQEDNLTCNILDTKNNTIIPNDMSHFVKLFVDDYWNEVVFGQLLDLCFSEKVNICKIKFDAVTDEGKNGDDSLNLILKTKLNNLILFFNKIMPTHNDYFIISSYLPLKNNFKIQLMLGQLPVFWRSGNLPKFQPNDNRHNFNILTDDKYNNMSFNQIIRTLIPQNLPMVYLEGYRELNCLIDNLGWPKSPKMIFTSNSYAADDIFKYWAAEKTEKGVPLFIGQHGGTFGINKFSFFEEHQIRISQSWISWGWSDENRQKVFPLGNFTSKNKKAKYDTEGYALMVELNMPRYSYAMYAVIISKQWLDYFNDQKKFLQLLPYQIRNKILVRFKKTDYGWDQAERLKDEMPEVKTDSGFSDINVLIKKSRIYISTYNATTYLESLSSNMPTLMFWDPKYWELNEDAKPYFEKLKKVGIFHETPESAAQQMIKIWDDVAEWWLSESVQLARRDFCERYTCISEKHLDVMKKLFRESAIISDG